MAAAVPALIGLGGSALGALGGSGKQQSQTGTSTSTTSGTQVVTPNEPGYFSQARQALLQPFFEQLQKAQQPVYGQSQKAQVLNDVNGLAADSVAKLKTLGGGVGRSGYFERSLGDIESKRLGTLGDFFSSLPAQESAAQFAKMSSLLGIGSNWFGHAPVGQTTVSNQSTDQSQSGSISGPGFGAGLAGNLGGLAGNIFGSWAGGQDWGKIFGGKNTGSNDQV